MFCNFEGGSNTGVVIGLLDWGIFGKKFDCSMTRGTQTPIYTYNVSRILYVRIPKTKKIILYSFYCLVCQISS